MKVKEIEQILDKNLRKEIAMSWDNVGLQIGDYKDDVSKILLALELTTEILNEAIEKKCDMILVHHPLIFSGVKKVVKDEENLIYRLIKTGISLYVSHTNFDMIDGGLNDYFAKKICAKKITPIYEENEEYGLLRIFEIENIKLKDFAVLLKNEFGLESIRIVGQKDDDISKVGLVTGSGFEYADLAQKYGVDVFVSGDLKYHQAMDFKSEKINVIDMGHFETESIFANAMKDFLSKVSGLNAVEFTVSEREISPFSYF